MLFDQSDFISISSDTFQDYIGFGDHKGLRMKHDDEKSIECANTLCNPPVPGIVHNETCSLTNSAILADMLEIHLLCVLEFTFAYACLSVCWSLRLGPVEEVHWALGVARIVEPHIRLK
jgi:streptomycin 6-kinase